MKKIYPIVLISFAIILIIFTIGCTSTDSSFESIVKEQNLTIFVGIADNNPPFCYIEDGVPQGFDVEAIRWIGKDQGFDVKYQVASAQNGFSSLQSGTIDVLCCGMTINDERLQFYNFSNPYWSVDQSVIVRYDSNLTFDDINNGKATIITLQESSCYSFIYNKLITSGIMPKENLFAVDSITLGISDIVSGEQDAVIFDTIMLKPLIKGEPVKIIGTYETNDKLGYMVRKDSNELLNKINAGLEKFMASDDFEELKKKYNME